jgi:hypothetical protein
MRIHILFYSIFFLFVPIELFGQYNIEAFTHPCLDIKQKVSLYRKPNEYFKELKSDTEAGWIVRIKQKTDNFFQIDIDDLKLHEVWIHKGDVGINVQNYDSIRIPVFIEPDTNSIISRYINEYCIGLIYDISDTMLFLKLEIRNNIIYGWIERKYLCGSPFTTCN